MSAETQQGAFASKTRFVLARAFAAAVCVFLAVFSWRLLERRESGQQVLLDFAMRSGKAVPREDFDRFLAPESDLTRARLRVARTVLEEQLDLRWIGSLPDAERPQAMLDSLQLLLDSRDVAGRVLAERPASWEAMLMLGATSYVHTLRNSPMRLVSDMEGWERPLLEARTMVPGAGQASRYIAMAYLDVWLSLSREKKEEALPVLRQAMTDSSTFDRLIDTWLRLVHDRQLALSIVPDQPAPWQRLMSIFEKKSDWRGFLHARVEWRKAYVADIHRQLDDAAERAQGGDVPKARERFRAIAARLEPSGFQRELLVRVLREAPPGPIVGVLESNLSHWLEWSLELCFLGRCPLEPGQLRRLAANAGRPQAPRAALAQIVAGNGAEARRIEADSIGEWSSEWGQYQILNARDLLDGAAAAERAAQALLRVSREWQETIPYWRVKARLAALTGDAAQARLAGRQLQSLSLLRWEAERWSRESRGLWHLVLAPASAGGTLTVSIADASEQGAVVELEWDGRLVTTLIVGPGTEVGVPVDVSADLHRLTLRQVTRSGRVIPGSVTLSVAGEPQSPSVSQSRF